MIISAFRFPLRDALIQCDRQVASQTAKSPIGVSEAPTALLARNRSTGGAFFEIVMQQTKQPLRSELESEIAWLRKQLERAMRERNAYQARAKELRSALMSIASQHPVLKGRQK